MDYTSWICHLWNGSNLWNITTMGVYDKQRWKLRYVYHANHWL